MDESGVGRQTSFQGSFCFRGFDRAPDRFRDVFGFHPGRFEMLINHLNPLPDFYAGWDSRSFFQEKFLGSHPDFELPHLLKNLRVQ